MKLSVIFLVLAVGVFVACPPQQDTLVMGTNATFPPFEFIGGANGDEVVGFDVDIAKEIAKTVGVELVIEDTEFDSLLPALQADKVDFVIAGMTITPERAENVDFSDPYYEATQSVIVDEGETRFQISSDLVGARVAVQLGTTGEGVAVELTGINNVSAFNSGFEAVSELNAGRVDAVIIDEQPAQNYVARNEGLKTINLDFEPEFYGIAVKKGNQELLEIINQTIREMKADGRYDALVEQYIAQ